MCLLPIGKLDAGVLHDAFMLPVAGCTCAKLLHVNMLALSCVSAFVSWYKRKLFTLRCYMGIPVIKIKIYFRNNLVCSVHKLKASKSYVGTVLF